jgi:hypothetical protein
MVDEGGRDLHVVVGHDGAAVTELVDPHERRERRPALVRHADVDVAGIHLEE